MVCVHLLTRWCSYIHTGFGRLQLPREQTPDLRAIVLICSNSKLSPTSLLLLRPLAGAKYCNQFVRNVHNVLNLHWPSLLAGKCSDRHQTCTRWTPGKPAICIQGVLKVKVKVKGHVTRALLCWHENRFLRIIGICGIFHYSRQVGNLLFLAFQYSSPGGSTTAGEVCYLRLPCLHMPAGGDKVFMATYADLLRHTCNVGMLVRERSALATLIFTLRVCLSVILSFCRSVVLPFCWFASAQL